MLRVPPAMRQARQSPNPEMLSIQQQQNPTINFLFPIQDTHKFIPSALNQETGGNSHICFAEQGTEKRWRKAGKTACSQSGRLTAPIYIESLRPINVLAIHRPTVLLKHHWSSLSLNHRLLPDGCSRHPNRKRQSIRGDISPAPQQ